MKTIWNLIVGITAAILFVPCMIWACRDGKES